MQNRSTQAIEAFARGEIVIVTDDDDRENEGDLIVAASLCTPEKMAFIIRNGCGIVCAPLTADDARRSASEADGGDERRPARHRLHRLGRHAPRPDHRHFRRAALQHGARARQRQYGRERFRAPRPCVPADRQGRRRADALRPYRGGGGPLQARRAAARRRHLRTRQRRRYGHGRPADRGFRAQAQTRAHLRRRPHRLSAGARETGRARRRPSRSRRRSASSPATPIERRSTRCCISPSCTARSATAAACRRGCTAPTFSSEFSAAASIPRRSSDSRRRVAACSSIFATARPACRPTSSAPSGEFGRRTRQAMARSRPGRANPARSRGVLDPAAHANSAQIRRALGVRGRDRGGGADRGAEAASRGRYCSRGRRPRLS